MSPRERLESLLAEFEPLIREAFLSAVDEIRNGVTLRVVVERLERGDINGAIASLGLEPEAFARLERAIAEAYNGGGTAVVGNFPIVRDPDGNRVKFYFGSRDLQSEAWLRNHSATLVTRTTEDMKEALRITFSEGLARGDNPTRTALNAVGRVNRASNRREGGVVGLTAQQARAVENARQRLLSGDPAALRELLTLGRRDKRFDRSITKLIREGRAPDAAFIAKWTGRYSDSLLRLRGDMIGLNETFTALEQSREDAIRQQIAAGKVDAQDVTVIWRHTPQEKPRLQHQAMNGKSVRWGEDFVLPDGTRMKHPHAEGAPASHTLGCKCRTEYKISFFARVERRFRAEAA